MYSAHQHNTLGLKGYSCSISLSTLSQFSKSFHLISSIATFSLSSHSSAFGVSVKDCLSCIWLVSNDLLHWELKLHLLYSDDASHHLVFFATFTGFTFHADLAYYHLRPLVWGGAILFFHSVEFNRSCVLLPVGLGNVRCIHTGDSTSNLLFHLWVR